MWAFLVLLHDVLSNPENNWESLKLYPSHNAYKIHTNWTSQKAQIHAHLKVGGGIARGIEYHAKVLFRAIFFFKMKPLLLLLLFLF